MRHARERRVPACGWDDTAGEWFERQTKSPQDYRSADTVRMIALAYSEARQLGNAYVGTEHLLLGLLREEAGIAAKVLTEHGAALDRVRQAVREVLEAMQAG